MAADTRPDRVYQVIREEYDAEYRAVVRETVVRTITAKSGRSAAYVAGTMNKDRADRTGYSWRLAPAPVAPAVCVSCGKTATPDATPWETRNGSPICHHCARTSDNRALQSETAARYCGDCGATEIPIVCVRCGRAGVCPACHADRMCDRCQVATQIAAMQSETPAPVAPSPLDALNAQRDELAAHMSMATGYAPRSATMPRAMLAAVAETAARLSAERALDPADRALVTAIVSIAARATVCGYAGELARIGGYEATILVRTPAAIIGRYTDLIGTSPNMEDLALAARPRGSVAYLTTTGAKVRIADYSLSKYRCVIGNAHIWCAPYELTDDRDRAAEARAAHRQRMADEDYRASLDAHHAL